jgi:large subunit ribosomal protein L6
MSRIGKKPVELPGGVSASVSGQTIEVKGPNGTRQWGMSRTQVANLVQGVTGGFKKDLEIRGVGYRAALQGNVLKLSLGYSHDVLFDIPEGIKVTCPKPTQIVVEGNDQQVVGQVAAEIRQWRKPEPYKGKGIRYVGEFVRQKAGKKK